MGYVLTGDGATTLPPLSSAAPVAFGFLVPEPASIRFGDEEFGGPQLAVKEGRTLSAVGGDVVVYGGALTAPGGQVQLVSVGSQDVFVPLDASQVDVGDYAAEYELLKLEDVAGKTKTMPDDFISPAGNGVTDAFLAYARPLVGELAVRDRISAPTIFKIRG